MNYFVLIVDNGIPGKLVGPFDFEESQVVAEKTIKELFKTELTEVDREHFRDDGCFFVPEVSNSVVWVIQSELELELDESEEDENE